MAFRPTLRPVDWSDVDSRGRYLRRKRSLEEESGEEDPQIISPTNDKSSSPPRKRKKVFGLPAVYYPPTLSPSEKLWREHYNFLNHRGYILRPRYQPNWTPTLLGNGRHYHSGEDHIMQIVGVIFPFSLSFIIIIIRLFVVINFFFIASPSIRCNQKGGWISCMPQDDPRPKKAEANQNHRVLFLTTDDGGFKKSRRPILCYVFRL